MADARTKGGTVPRQTCRNPRPRTSTSGPSLDQGTRHVARGNDIAILCRWWQEFIQKLEDTIVGA